MDGKKSSPCCYTATTRCMLDETEIRTSFLKFRRPLNNGRKYLSVVVVQQRLCLWRVGIIQSVPNRRVLGRWLRACLCLLQAVVILAAVPCQSVKHAGLAALHRSVSARVGCRGNRDVIFFDAKMNLYTSLHLPQPAILHSELSKQALHVSIVTPQSACDPELAQVGQRWLCIHHCRCRQLRPSLAQTTQPH